MPFFHLDEESIRNFPTVVYFIPLDPREEPILSHTNEVAKGFTGIEPNLAKLLDHDLLERSKEIHLVSPSKQYVMLTSNAHKVRFCILEAPRLAKFSHPYLSITDTPWFHPFPLGG